MSQKYEVIKEWYNGYVFGETNVYNPWSVMQYVDDLKANINRYPSSYWANTSSNSIVKSLIERADEENRFIEFAIPNKEVKYIFKTKILKWFNEKIKLSNMTKLFNSIINKEPEIFEEELGKLLIETISFNDAYENFYHGFLAEVLTNMNGYIVKSNREGGTGRSDIFIKSVSKRGIAIVIEFKIAKDIDDLEKRAEDAIKQIENKKYDMELRSEGYKNIVKYGIAFYQKDCLVKIKE